MNRLSVEELETSVFEPTAANIKLLAAQLADTMRENERLHEALDFIETIEINVSNEHVYNKAFKMCQAKAREALSNKESGHG